MKLQQLRYLCAIADCGFNISRAAELLHTSQPGVSKQVRMLEEQLNTNIFVRRNGRIVDVSERGQKVLEAARRMLKDADNLRYMGDEFTHAENGGLTLAAMHIHVRYFLFDVITKFSKVHPHVRINLLQGTPGKVSERVMSGEVDIGVTIEPLTAELHGLLQISCRPVPRSVIVPAGHPLLLKPQPSLEDIASYRIVAGDPSSALDWTIRRTFQSHGIELDIAMHAVDATVIKAFVEAGVGIAMLPTATFEPQRDRELRAIDVNHLFRSGDLRLIIDPYRYLRSFAYDFIELVAPEWTRAKVDQAMAEKADQERIRSGVT
jgi:LysR family cys regulon transcriptional activator